VARAPHVAHAAAPYRLFELERSETNPHQAHATAASTGAGLDIVGGRNQSHRQPVDRVMDEHSRRDILSAFGGLAAALLAGCSDRPRPRTTAAASPEPRRTPVTERMPTIYVPHGGGPWPFVDVPGMPPSAMSGLLGYFEGLSETPPAPPRAVLVVSAHWETGVPTVMTSRRPPMLYDYYGFPPESYALEWPAPGAPEIAEEVRAALRDAGIETSEDDARGFDHGTFVVTKVAWPRADVPTFQLSLMRDLDPARHLAVGRALAPLRDAGVLILGSGMSYHNMRGFGESMRGNPAPSEDARAFDAWLAETVAADESTREQRLVEWARAPKARECHPREEHLIPLMVIAGSSAGDAPSIPFRGTVVGLSTLAAQFG
jgi:aromatic ring-opening dioxygenase catalytic subunit (LigB family)